MNILGFKGCNHCGKKLDFHLAIKQIFINDYKRCSSCGKDFKYSSTRAYLSWILMSIIIFAPTLIFFLELPSTLLEHVLEYSKLKYIFGFIVLYLVSGNEKIKIA